MPSSVVRDVNRLVNGSVRTSCALVLSAALSWACAAKPAVEGSSAAAVSAGAVAPTSSTDAPEEAPADQFAAVEQRLLTADPLRVVFAVRSEGQYPADVRGMLLFEGKTTRLEAKGTFAGETLDIVMTSDGEKLIGANAGKRFELPQPADLRGGLVIGFTRMGILHNVAMLSGGRPPDRVDGSVREWVTCNNFVPARDGTDGLRFEVQVEGKKVADAGLTLDARGLPTARTQTVHFEGGTMTVEESYAEVHIGGAP